MRTDFNLSPRCFEVGLKDKITLSDCGSVFLEANEGITFRTDSGTEYDFYRKSWGYYATPSLNGRLSSHGLKAVLVQGPTGKYFVWVVENGQEEGFQEYLESENHQVIAWLDKDENLSKINRLLNLKKPRPMSCMCESPHFELVFKYTKRPPDEIDFGLEKDKPYSRELYQCTTCSHLINRHDYDIDSLYEDTYVSANYGGLQGIKKRFDKIMSLPEGHSDNRARVTRVCEWWIKQKGEIQNLKVLDVGAGLGVFPFAMKKRGADCTAIDPDTRHIAHIESLEIMAVASELKGGLEIGKFSLMTMNRILEHVKEPIAVLRCAHEYLDKGGVVYIELPDGETAIQHSAEREEFTIDHWHAFSLTSVGLLCKRSGFKVLDVHRVQEPSGKFSLYAMAEADSF